MVQLFRGDDEPHETVADFKALLRTFWDAENPDYIMSSIPTTWEDIWLTRETGFQQTGVLPMPSGPHILVGWRKCH